MKINDLKTDAKAAKLIPDSIFRNLAVKLTKFVSEETILHEKM